MPEDITKRITVTFGTGLPHGTHAHFKHEGQMWIAYPAPKITRIVTVIDQMLGIHATLQRRLIDWLNTRPADSDQIVTLLDDVRRGRTELITEKQRSQTQ